MIKRKVCIVVTARPSYSRVKTVLTAVKNHPQLELQLVVAASALLDRYGTAVDYIERDGFKIDAKVYNVLEGENLSAAAKTTGIGIIELSTVFTNVKPDIVVTVADRFETIATAIAASYMNIPLAHIQGGEVTGNIDEKVRHAVTKLSDYHFVSTEGAKNRVLKLGENSEFVFNTGCPSIDLAYEVMNHRKNDFDPIKFYGGVGVSIDTTKDYIVVMQHPVTTEYKESRKHIEETLYAVNELKIPTFWFWPNIDAGADGISKGIRSFRERYNLKHIHFFKNMDPLDFLELLLNSICLIGNSSVGIRECSFMGVPVVNIGTRQNRRERGNNVINCNYSKEEITKSILYWMNNKKPEPSLVYGGGDAGRKIAELLNKIPLQYHKTISY
jgi:GDP/UDP-N,N'-diacetylbacillosamine 2-epimerase (hydrolysing)